MQICGNSGLPFPWYRVCTKAIFLPKGSFGNREPKNVTLLSLRTRKLRTFMQRGIVPTVQIYGNSGLPFAMVSCFHQSNLYTKRKLREWRTQKFNPCFGAVSPLRSTCPQTTYFNTGWYRATVQIYRNSGLPFAMVPCLHQNNLYTKRKLRELRTQNCNPCFGEVNPLRSTGRKLHTFMQRGIERTVQIYGNSGLPFAMVPCLHHGNLSTKRRLREWKTQKCNPCFGAVSPLRSTGPQTTHFHAARYRADSANLRKLGTTFHHGTVFSPKQSLYQKEATGKEHPEM